MESKHSLVLQVLAEQSTRLSKHEKAYRFEQKVRREIKTNFRLISFIILAEGLLKSQQVYLYWFGKKIYLIGGAGVLAQTLTPDASSVTGRLHNSSSFRALVYHS